MVEMRRKDLMKIKAKVRMKKEVIVKMKKC